MTVRRRRGALAALVGAVVELTQRGGEAVDRKQRCRRLLFRILCARARVSTYLLTFAAPVLAACNLVEDNLHTMQVPAFVNPGVGGPPSLHRWAPTRHKHVPQGG